MKNYQVKITETYGYYIKIEAEGEKEALEKAKSYYENVDDGYAGVADSLTIEQTKFKIVKNR